MKPSMTVSRARRLLVEWVIRAMGDDPRYPKTRKVYQHGRYLFASDSRRYHVADMGTADPVPGAFPAEGDMIDSLAGLIGSCQAEERVVIILPADSLKQALVTGSKYVVLTSPKRTVANVAEVVSLGEGLNVLTYALVKLADLILPPNAKVKTFRPDLKGETKQG